jgi:hypothetical protein
MGVLAVVGQVESGPFEEQAGAGGHATLGDFSARRARDFTRGIRDLAVEALEVVTFRTTVLVSRHWSDT